MNKVTDSPLDRLPAHERRRLARLEGVDLDSLARRRLAGEPLQYLEGSAPFADFEVAVDSRVLIPRPETEGLYELAAASVDSPRRMVDLGTGSGVIAIALARRFPRSSMVAIDISPAALDLARDNAERLGVEVDFRQGDLFEPLPVEFRGRVDLLVSNPPYVAESEWEELPEDVHHEPRIALIAGPRGDEVLVAIARQAPTWLRPGGVVVCEIGETQAELARTAFEDVGMAEIRPDLAGRPRYLIARRTT